MPELDNGDILGQREVSILDTDTGGSLFEKISITGAELLADTIAKIQSGTVERIPQDESFASYFGYPSDQDTRIDWERGAERVRNQIRGLMPGRGAWTVYKGTQVHLLHAEIAAHPSTETPGKIVGHSPKQITVATSTYDLIIDEISLNGYYPTPVSQLFMHHGVNTEASFEL